MRGTEYIFSAEVKCTEKQSRQQIGCTKSYSKIEGQTLWRYLTKLILRALGLCWSSDKGRTLKSLPCYLFNMEIWPLSPLIQAFRVSPPHWCTNTVSFKTDLLFVWCTKWYLVHFVMSWTLHAVSSHCNISISTVSEHKNDIPSGGTCSSMGVLIKRGLAFVIDRQPEEDRRGGRGWPSLLWVPLCTYTVSHLKQQDLLPWMTRSHQGTYEGQHFHSLVKRGNETLGWWIKISQRILDPTSQERGSQTEEQEKALWL